MIQDKRIGISGESTMIRIQKITALLCALALAASSFGAYTDNARAASFPVTSDDAPLYRETPERSPARSTRANTEIGRAHV